MNSMNFFNFENDQALDQNIYRIMKQDHVISLFNNRQNAISQVRKWKDKFENFQMKLGHLVYGETHEIIGKNQFVGQCWSTQKYSEAMWGIYANDPEKRYLRIRSTPRKLLRALVAAHPKMPRDTCFLGKVEYLKENDLRRFYEKSKKISNPTNQFFAKALLLKRIAFNHEKEVRLIYFDWKREQDKDGLYWYDINPNQMIDQIMADPNRNRLNWLVDKASIKANTGFHGEIKRSKIYDPPDW